MPTSRYIQIMRTFGKTLKTARKRAGYDSAASFANVLGKEPHTYRYWERGEAQPDLETLVRICELLGITPNDLLPAAVPANHGGKTANGAPHH